MTRAHALTLAALALVGCATSEPVRGPDGTMDWFAISCSHRQSYCWSEAGRRCPAGYDVADESQRTGLVAAASSTSAFATTNHRGDMLVHCHGASPTTPHER